MGYWTVHSLSFANNAQRRENSKQKQQHGRKRVRQRVCVCVCVLVDVYAYVCRGQNNGKKAQLQTGWPTGPYRDAGACCDSDGRLSVTTRASAFRFCLACPSGVYRLVFAAHYERRPAWNRRLSTRQGYSKQTSLQTPETRCDPTEASPSLFSRLGLVFFSFNTASRELFCSIFNRSEILARVWNVGPGRPFFCPSLATSFV